MNTRSLPPLGILTLFPLFSPSLLQGLWLQDAHCGDGSQFYRLDPSKPVNNKAIVTFGTVRGRENCMEVDPEHAITMFYRDNYCRFGRNEYEEFSPHKPTSWEPKCLIVLLAAESRMALRDELIEAGRILVQPLRIDFNYTVALSSNPDLAVSASNCALGRELLNLYQHDLAGQAERDALVNAQQQLAAAQAQFTLFENTYNGLSAYRPPISPPPPPPPLPPASGEGASLAPPAAPGQVSLGERLEQLRDRVTQLTVEVAQRDAAIQLCVPSADHICGRSSLLAPNPWLANNNEECVGYSTLEAFEGAYCGYWGSEVRCHSNEHPSQPITYHSVFFFVSCFFLFPQVNVDAADAAEAAELQSPEGAPYCFSAAGTALKCPVTAARTIRSGKWELLEWSRIDRPYCQSDIFKELVLDNATVGEAECRNIIAERLHNCERELCSPCISPCNYPVARTLASIFRCVDGQKHLGFLHYYMNSDAGQLARSMHGAIRKDSYKAVPEKLGAHLYHIGHYNPKGYLQRDSISCRRENRNSPMARFVPGFDDEGMPVSRSGFMVPCRKHSDCGACSRHPLTGQVRASLFC